MVVAADPVRTPRSLLRPNGRVGNGMDARGLQDRRLQCLESHERD